MFYDGFRFVIKIFVIEVDISSSDRTAQTCSADSPGLIHKQSTPVQSWLFSLISSRAHFCWFLFIPLYFLVITGGT